jgi:ATP-dependent Clp endopeptidase proteolytic subunit ClpP
MKTFTSKKTKEQVQEDVAEEEVVVPQQFIVEGPEDSISRNVGLFGDVGEETSGELVKTLLTLRDIGAKEEKVRGKTVIKNDPINFYICTNGGSANDMFAIYDTMRWTKNVCEIHTIGLGKVMSAGVLLLASGTKGKRKVGKHCRIMIHSVAAGNEGPIHNLQNEMEEVNFTQQAYISALRKETKMSEQTIKKMFEKHVNIYLSAEEAVKLGIADEVI